MLNCLPVCLSFKINGTRIPPSQKTKWKKNELFVRL